MWNESWKKSKLLLETLQSQRMVEKRQAEIKKLKKKQRKVSRAGTEEEFKRLLEQLKAADIGEEKCGDEKVVPAYFILKVSQDSLAELQNMNGMMKNLKLVLANEDLPRKMVGMKDQILQACIATEEPRGSKPQKVLGGEGGRGVVHPRRPRPEREIRDVFGSCIIDRLWSREKF